MPRKQVNPRNLQCPIPSCPGLFANQAGITIHIRNDHRHVRKPSTSTGSHSTVACTTQSTLPPTVEGQDNPGSPPDFDHVSPELDHPDSSESWDEQGPYVVETHPLLNGRPCDESGQYFPNGTPPPPFHDPPPDDFYPYENRTSFELADLLFRREEMSGGNIDDLLAIWAADSDRDPPFSNKQDLYETIDATIVGDIPWQSFTLTYQEELGATPEPWMTKKYEVHYRCPRQLLRRQLGSREFATQIDHAPKKVFNEKGRVYRNFMEGRWIWRQADKLAENPDMHGCVPVATICGSDKTTVSVATGQNEYYPFYLSQGNIHNNLRRAHGDGISLCAFLAIPKTDREHEDSANFRRFRRHLFHASLREILSSLQPGMSVPEVIRFGDGHYRRVVYCLGPYIADYPEQVLLACVVQNWCTRCDANRTKLDGEGGHRSHELTEALMEVLSSRQLWDDYRIVDGIMPFTHYFPGADIHELIAPDLLHQIIKGSFKDHLVTWVDEYFDLVYTKSEVKKIKAELDRRIAAVPPFPNLRRFKEGRGYKQWTGDDSKALMKLYLPAIAGLVPAQMVRTFSAFLEFCYLVRRDVIDQDTLTSIDYEVARFHREREVFANVGVRDETTLGFSLPRQHAMSHYHFLIEEFAAPNGVCSSITESKHIVTVKKPWRRSRRFEALGQMLTVNERLDKLCASRIDFQSRGMLHGPLSESIKVLMGKLPADDDDDDGGGVDDFDIEGKVSLARTPLRNLPKDVEALAAKLNIPELPFLINRFLYFQDHPDADHNANIAVEDLPKYSEKVSVYPSAVATFYAPSNQSGVGGMFRERIRSTASWQNGPARRDCVFVVNGDAQDEPGFRGLFVAQVLLFFSIKRRKDFSRFPCALVTWFSTWGNEPCPDTSMW